MLNKARGSSKLVIINSRGHQFFNHSARRQNASALVPNRRERKRDQRHLNPIGHTGFLLFSTDKLSLFRMLYSF